MDGGVYRTDGGLGTWATVNGSPSSCIKFKGDCRTKLPLINCKQKGSGESGEAPGLAFVISTSGQMMSSIRPDTAICHLFPHQSNLNVLTRSRDMRLCMCALWRQRGMAIGVVPGVQQFGPVPYHPKIYSVLPLQIQKYINM